MFLLRTLRDLVKLHPSSQNRPTSEVVCEQLDSRYGNRILPGVGLCICVYELTEVGDAIIIPGDGCAYTEVTFQLVIFRPMEDEVLTGTIKAWNHQGLQVSLIFFEDIFIPASMMMEGSQFNETEDGEGEWEWRYDPGDGSEVQSFLYDKEAPLKLRVTGVLFNTHATDKKPPAVDRWGNAVPVPGLPEDASATPSEATVEPSEDGTATLVTVPALSHTHAAAKHAKSIQRLFACLSTDTAGGSGAVAGQEVEEGGGTLGLVAHEPVMQVTGTTAESGLGMAYWWDAGGGEEEEEEGGDEGGFDDDEGGDEAADE